MIPIIALLSCSRNDSDFSTGKEARATIGVIVDSTKLSTLGTLKDARETRSTSKRTNPDTEGILWDKEENIYINAEGEKEFRDPTLGYWTLKQCFERFEKMKKQKSGQYFNPYADLGAIVMAANAFKCDSLIHQIIDWKTTNWTALKAKMYALGFLDTSYNEAPGLREALMQGLKSDFYQARYYAAINFVLIGNYEVAEPVLVEMAKTNPGEYFGGWEFKRMRENPEANKYVRRVLAENRPNQ